MFIDKVDKLDISNSQFTNNTSIGSGGAIYVNYASTVAKLTFSGVNFLNNTSLSGDGGSVLLNAVYFSSFDLCSFTSNRALLGKGGAVSVKYLHIIFINKKNIHLISMLLFSFLGAQIKLVSLIPISQRTLQLVVEECNLIMSNLCSFRVL